MAKYVKEEDERYFIMLDIEIKDRTNVLEKLKTRFRKLFDRGYKFKLLTPKPSVGRVVINWEYEANELATRYMGSAEQKRWLERITRHYKPIPVATSFIVPKEK